MKKYIGISLFCLVVMSFAVVGEVKANPSIFSRFSNILSQRQAVASTTPVFLTPGSATSTVYADVGAGNWAADNATLFMQVNASSTGSIPTWRYEYADDTPGANCVNSPTACDWYGDSLYKQGITYSTTTDSAITYVPTFQTTSWRYASSTDGCATGFALSSINRACRSFVVPTPSRYVRAVIYLPIGSTNASVWATFLTRKENI